MQCWNQEHGFETVVELAVHESHLKFILEIADRAKASDDEVCPYTLGEMREQSVEGLHRDSVFGGEDFR